jgi:phosphinothricin acetyltransferase
VASDKLLVKHGFAVLGRFPALGYKFDRWIGVIHMQREL